MFCKIDYSFHQKHDSIKIVPDNKDVTLEPVPLEANEVTNVKDTEAQPVPEKPIDDQMEVDQLVETVDEITEEQNFIEANFDKIFISF